MKTTYLTTLTTTYNPFSTSSKVPRLFLTLLSASAYKTVNIKVTQLPRTSLLPAKLELGFKDGKKLQYEWAERSKVMVGQGKDGEGEKGEPVTLSDVVNEVDKHARVTGRREELAG